MSRIYDALKKLEEERARTARDAPERPADTLPTRIGTSFSVPQPHAERIEQNKALLTGHRRRVNLQMGMALGIIGVAAAWAAWQWSVAGPSMLATGTPVVDGAGPETGSTVPPSEGGAADAPPPGEVAEGAMQIPHNPEATTPGSAPRAGNSSTASRGLVLQVGAFLRPENAEVLRGRLAEEYRDVSITIVERDGRPYHCVRIGGLNEDERRTATIALRQAGYMPIAVYQ